MRTRTDGISARAVKLALALAAAGCGGTGEGGLSEDITAYTAPLTSTYLSLQAIDPIAANTPIELDQKLPKMSYDMPEPGLDWVHWGRLDATAVNRQRGVIALIPTYTKVGGGTVTHTASNAPSFRWNAGAPTKVNTTGSSGGIQTSGANNGFQLSIPVHADTMYCHVYGQAFGAAGQLSLSISDNSAPAKTATLATGKAFDAVIGFSGKAPAKVNVVLKSVAANGSIVLNAAACGHGSVSPIGLSLDPMTSGEPYFLQSGASTRPLKASVFADSFVKMAFYRDGVKFAEDTTAPFQAETPLVPGFRFFQVVATRADGTTYTTSPLRVPVWIGHPVSAGVVTIPDNNPAGITQSMNVAEGPSGMTIVDFLYRPDIEHPYVSDLRLEVTSPKGTTVVVADNVGNAGDNFSYTSFWDAASTYITQGAAPFSGFYKPMNPFSAFNGQSPNGTWKFKVVDHAASDVGVWNWKMFWVFPD